MTEKGDTGRVADLQVPSFTLTRGPRLIFGAGRLSEIGKLAAAYGHRILLLTGHRSNKEADIVLAALTKLGFRVSRTRVQGEPTVALVDQLVEKYRPEGIELVIGMGGGSVMDAAKAVSAMLPNDASVRAYLEGVGDRLHNGKKVPFIAIPTTSGTGSEATRNAVLREAGEQGFKKSLRHDNLAPDLALIDPQLMLSCPPTITAACGLDALTQLLESYVSTGANPLTDALAFSGILHFKAGFLPAYREGAVNLAARGAMAYAALMSGITLSAAGLGVVHGLAGPLGGFFDIPHGVACGSLMAVATGVNIHWLRHHAEREEAELHLAKYAMVGHMLSDKEPKDINEGCDLLVEALNNLINETAIPRLDAFGVKETDLEKVVAAADLKNNPARLSPEDLLNILKLRL